MSHVAAGSHSKGGLRTVPLRRAGGGGGGRGRRARGAHPIRAGSGREQGQRDSLPVAPGRDHARTRTPLHVGRLLSADFRVPPRRWYDPQPPSGSPAGLVPCLSSSQQRVPWARGARFPSLVEGHGGNPAPLLKLRSRGAGAQRGGLARELQGHPGESWGGWR